MLIRGIPIQPGNLNSAKHEAVIVDSPAGLVPVVRTRDAQVAIPSDEPVFVLRARDLYSVTVLGAYLNSVKEGSPSEHVQAVENVVADFVQWREQHPDLVRIPD
jgi:hypothetical protein